MNKIHPETFKFFKELKKNNNKEWFHANKMRYSAIREGFIQFLESVYPYLCEFDPELKGIDIRKSVFRVNRDIRFSKDKSPYKIQMGAYLAKGGRKSTQAGYYLHIEPGNSFIAGGSYCPPSDILKKIRSEIYYNVKEFKSIINSKNFKSHFGNIQGSKLVRPPVGFPKDFEEIDLLKFKDYTIFYPVNDKTVMNPSFPDRAIEIFEEMNPFNDFINRAVSS